VVGRQAGGYITNNGLANRGLMCMIRHSRYKGIFLKSRKWAVKMSMYKANVSEGQHYGHALPLVGKCAHSKYCGASDQSPVTSQPCSHFISKVDTMSSGNFALTPLMVAEK
jgi:hypothetical protein